MKQVALFTILILSIFGIALSFNKVFAATNGSICIPSACPNNYEPDLNCISSKFTDPGNTCCINKCKSTGNVTQLPSQFSQFEVFGTKFRLNPESIPSLVNLGFSAFLGIVSVYAILRGIYVAGVKRANATTADDIGKLNQELSNIVVGFVIAWAFILIIQIVANILGVGELSKLDVTSQDGGDNNIVIVIK